MEPASNQRTPTQDKALQAIDRLIELMGACASEIPEVASRSDMESGCPDEGQEGDLLRLPKPRTIKEACQNLQRLRGLVEQSFAST